MIVPDINLLVYAYNSGATNHAEARRWWEDTVNGDRRVGLPWAVVNGFVRLMTNPKVVAPPMSAPAAVDFVKSWFQYAHIIPVNPGVRHLEYLRQNLDAAGVGANLVTDAHIAAVAMEYQAEVHSNDADFGRFPGLRWVNPL